MCHIRFTKPVSEVINVIRILLVPGIIGCLGANSELSAREKLLHNDTIMTNF